MISIHEWERWQAKQDHFTAYSQPRQMNGLASTHLKVGIRCSLFGASQAYLCFIYFAFSLFFSVHMQLSFVSCTLLLLTWQHVARGEHWADPRDTACLPLLSSVPAGMSLLARFPQPLPAVPLGRKNSVSELFSHLSPTCSLWSFLFQCTISSSLCQHCHRRQKKTCSVHCRLLLLVPAL